MERKIGEIFEYDGIKLRVVKEIRMCDGCFFKGSFKCAASAPKRGECQFASRSDDGVIFIEVGNMEGRNIKLSLEKAKEFYAKGGEFKDLALSAFSEEELTKKELPKTWEEYIKYWAKERKAVRLRDMAEVELDKFEVPNDIISSHNKLMTLHLLRDCYRQGWVPNWNDGTIKHCIKAKGRAVYLYTSQQTNQFLSFQTKDVADEFMNNFSNLIQQAADLI